MSWSGVRPARARGAFGARTSVIVCGIIAVAIAVFGKAEASIFDTARAKLSDMTGPALLEVRVPLMAFERWIESVGTIFSVYRENIELRKENAELRKWQDVALSLENRIRRYELLLNSVPDIAPPAVTARVIGESNRPFVRTMILNAGTDQGVTKGQAVANERGLIGRIYLTGKSTSWVILLTDVNSRVPVVIEPSMRRAILAGDNTPAPLLDLDLGIGATSTGDRVLSTGDGGLLPAGLPVGVVMGEGNELRVSLFAVAAASDYVRVLDYIVPPPPSAPADVSPAVAGTKQPAPTATASASAVARPAGVIRKAPTPPADTAGAAGSNVEEDR
jgi:rod shape-determining protein MreC